MIVGKDIDKAGQEEENKELGRGNWLTRHDLRTMREECEAEGHESNQN